MSETISMRIKPIPGIQWAADILTGQKPFHKQAPHNHQESGDFKAVFDEKMENLRKAKGETP